MTREQARHEIVTFRHDLDGAGHDTRVVSDDEFILAGKPSVETSDEEREHRRARIAVAQHDGQYAIDVDFLEGVNTSGLVRSRRYTDADERAFVGDVQAFVEFRDHT